jgi:Bifunctional PLP-dependent enzyme with beta-cystathionase and maltose regulon repressor activities
MKYNFDLKCDRSNTNCVKWDAVKDVFGREDVIPMWVADMDFPAAKPIVAALKKRAAHEFYGYTKPGQELIEAIVSRMRRKFNWQIRPEWIVFTPGVIPALSAAARAVSRPGDEIVLQEPVYFPFFSVVTQSGCKIVNNPLKFDGKRYTMDLRDLESKFRPVAGSHLTHSRAKAVIFCNPQNPIGRLWTKAETTRMGEIVIRNGGIVISDEIHCEILYKGYRHTPFAAISDEFAQNSVVCMAPSKTFNLAGLHASCIIIPNQKLRESFSDSMAAVVPGPNVFGLVAMEAAFRQGDDWLAQMLDYLNGNLKITMEFFAKRIPQIKVIKPQGTYLLWLDCRKLGLDNQALSTFMRAKARVGFDDGFLFGESGSGFERMNIACPRMILLEALSRIEQAVNSL